MKEAMCEELTLKEINERFGLPETNDFSKYIDKHDNGVFRMDRNYDYTAYFANSLITYIITISGDTWSKYISNEHKEHLSSLKLYKKEDGYIADEKIKKASLKFNNTNIECYGIVSSNVFVSFLNDEEVEMFEEMEKQIEPPDKNPYDDIPYLGLPDYEQETGHWNID